MPRAGEGENGNDVVMGSGQGLPIGSRVSWRLIGSLFNESDTEECEGSMGMGTPFDPGRLAYGASSWSFRPLNSGFKEITSLVCHSISPPTGECGGNPRRNCVPKTVIPSEVDM